MAIIKTDDFIDFFTSEQDGEKSQEIKPKTRLDEFQPIPVRKRMSSVGHLFDSKPVTLKPNSGGRKGRKIIISLVVVILVYFFVPIRTNILILGTDYLPPRDPISRTDTNILMTIIPLKPFIAMLSIPRDLWVNIPGIGQNRINSAYFFAELNKKGTGPDGSVRTVMENFGVNINYYIVINMEGLSRIIDSIGGVEVNLPKDMGGLKQGKHFLNGTQALAFVRERYSSDDFSRITQGQFLIKAYLEKIISPVSWFKFPMLLVETYRSIKTNIPFWLLPRLALAVFRTGPGGLEAQTINRDMVTPFTTVDGAQVLAPNWENINPLIMKLFGQ